jgi:hypothetical protein
VLLSADMDPGLYQRRAAAVHRNGAAAEADVED